MVIRGDFDGSGQLDERDLDMLGYYLRDSTLCRQWQLFNGMFTLDGDPQVVDVRDVRGGFGART